MAFKVMTWNVENLFVPELHSDALPQPKFDEKLDLISDIVTLLNPDVVAFQELGEGALSIIQQRLAPAYSTSHESKPDHRTIRVGILSKFPFIKTNDLVLFPPSLPAIFDEEGKAIVRMGRGAPHVELLFEGRHIHVISAHLKSKLLTFPGGLFSTSDETLRAQVAAIALNKRTAEATTIRLAVNTILADQPDHAVVVMGDFNDDPHAATSELLLGPSGSEIGTLGFSRPDKGDAERLFNTAPSIINKRRYSRIHRGVGELLDQVLASEEMFPRSGDNQRRLEPIADSHIDIRLALPSIGSNPNVRLKEILPDHAPVTAIFQL